MTATTFGAPWFTALPAEWSVLPFKRVALVREGQVDPRDETVAALPLFAPNHIESGSGRLLQIESASDQGAISGKYPVAAGEIVYSKIRPALRKIIIAPRDGLCSADMYAIRPKHGVDRKFLFWAMLSEGFSSAAVLASDRVAMPKVNRETLAEFPLPLAPIPTQKSIADYLDRKTAAIDALIEKKERLIALLAEKRAALINQAVTKGLDPDVPMKDSGVPWIGEIPAHWEVARLSFRYGRQLGKMLNPTAAIGPNQAPYLGNKDVQWDHVRVDDLSTMSFSPAEREKFSLQYGDLLVCEGGEAGRTAVWREELDECFFQKAIHRLRPFSADRDFPRFHYYSMFAAKTAGAFEEGGNKATIGHLTGEALSAHRFPWPPKQEQFSIACFLDGTTERTSNATKCLEQQLDRLREYRQALITAAVTGQIDVGGQEGLSGPKLDDELEERGMR